MPVVLFNVCDRFLICYILKQSKTQNTANRRMQLKAALGQPIKGYGRDHGGKRVGRRNFVEHKKFKDEDEIEHTR